MGNIVWLASYPKSGNTWLRILLTNYWRNSEQPASINQLKPTLLAAERHGFEDIAGLEASDLTADEIDRHRPCFYQRCASQQPGRLFVKVHDAFTQLPDGRLLFPPTLTEGAIYLVRNPLDVAVSFAAHNGQTPAQTIPVMGRASYRLCGSTRSLSPQLRQQLGSWSSHVYSWVDQARQHIPVCLVRYEDLLEHPHTTFDQVLAFLGEPVDEARRDRALAFSAFERLQQQEATLGFAERPGAATRFFRQGRAGDWRDHLTPEQVAQVVADHTALMERFGYGLTV